MDKESSCTHGDWTSLPNLVSFIIFEKFSKSIDVVQFGLVCKQWYLASKEYIETKRDIQRKALPVLLIPTKRGRKKKSRKLYCVIERKFISEVSVRSNKKFCGSSHGWIAFNDENGIITLVNPFKNGTTIQLPRLHIQKKTINYWQDLRKLVLSEDPSLCPQSFIAVAMFGGYQTIAYIKAGQESWTMIDNGIFNMTLTIFIDVIFYKGLVYAVTYRGLLVCFDVSQPPPVQVKILVDPGIHESTWKNKVYLVESSKGELLLVERYYDNWANWTKTFKVFNLVIDNEDGHLIDKVELKSLDGDGLFLGQNYSMSISDMNFLENQRDSIYYTDDFERLSRDHHPGDRDIGIFRVKDGTRKHLYAYKPSQKYLPPILWIVPPYGFHSCTSALDLKKVM
ncbi:uncharacterized protein [Rutidosis leptorrhynchoides]|uniref:uncharacterized protein n=1 Tax=Rutidosis leptorrhynchoides TaxID=125765 RepID=UPI003A99C0E1